MIAVPLLMLLLLTIAQFALYLHATHIAQAAAAQGLSATRIDGGSTAAGTAEAQGVLTRLGGGTLLDTHVTAQRGPAQATVSVTGSVVQVIPFLSFTAHGEAAGPVEAFSAPTGRTP